MKLLVNAEEMRELDRNSIEEIGIPSMVLMERAALSVVEEIKKRRPGRQHVIVFAGTGNNGADGLAIARMMTLLGDKVRVVVTGNRSHATPDWNTQFSICEKLGVAITPDIPDLDESEDASHSVIVDAMLGTGLTREVTGKTAEAVDWINESRGMVISVDIPSGISADTGAVLGTAVKAHLTVTFEVQKLGLALYPGAEYAGTCVTRSIGIVQAPMYDYPVKKYTLSPEDLEDLPARPALSNKGTFGRVLLIAGSRNMAGAAVLAGEAAYRSGAGLVRVLTPECNRTVLQSALPEAILTTYEDVNGSEDLLAAVTGWASAIVIGPGLGLGDTAVRLVRYVLTETEVPVVIDADALNILALHTILMDHLNSRCILTPHLGELSRLSGKSIQEMREDLCENAVNFATKHKVCLVQKDARTIVVPSDGSFVYVNTCGNSGMATGGSGDVLSGVLGGLLAGGLEVPRAAVFGVLMHSHAGDTAAARRGERAVLAGDIIKELT